MPYPSAAWGATQPLHTERQAAAAQWRHTHRKQTNESINTCTLHKLPLTLTNWCKRTFSCFKAKKWDTQTCFLKVRGTLHQRICFMIFPFVILRKAEIKMSGLMTSWARHNCDFTSTVRDCNLYEATDCFACVGEGSLLRLFTLVGNTSRQLEHVRLLGDTWPTTVNMLYSMGASED